ncbi:hypothetical protein F6X51_14030 [Methylobacterium planeticum]|uniref:Uncharacterized protein n=2 Tax=Methylobacterium planeticum TaxID=2615211 RepID=A0A6N6MV18_9HYPH|nr:hypothetical protein F6X51_14030 [Methylobacterium planeticum]
MCSRLVRFVLRANGRRERHRFAPAQPETGAAFYDALPRPISPEATVLHVVDGIALTTGRAVQALLRSLGLPWGLLVGNLGLRQSARSIGGRPRAGHADAARAGDAPGPHAPRDPRGARCIGETPSPRDGSASAPGELPARERRCGATGQADGP